jgi:hypothetical protein
MPDGCFRSRTTVAVLVVALSCSVPTGAPRVAAQQSRDATSRIESASGTAAIAGSLVTQTGSPVRRARVTVVSRVPAVSRTTESDDQGAFVFEALPAAAYTLTASKPGLLEVIYGQRVPGSGRAGTPIRVEEQQRVDQLKVTMPRMGAITGLVVDEYGDPAFNVNVRALRYVIRDGVRTLVAASSATSDDRGIYRLMSLLPGDYIVTATTRDALANDGSTAARVRAETERLRELAGAGSLSPLAAEQMIAQRRAALATPEVRETYATVYYPGASPASTASTVAVGVGEEQTGIDVQLRRVPVARLTGQVILPEGARLSSDVMIVDVDNRRSLHGVRSTAPDAEGRFTVTAVTPGPHRLAVFASRPQEAPADAQANVRPTRPGEARTRFPSAPPSDILWAMTEVSANGQPIDGVTLALQPGFTITGTLMFDGAPPPDVSALQVDARPATSDVFWDQPAPLPSRLDASGRFTVRGIVPGEFRISVRSLPPGWAIKSAMVGGVDVQDLPLSFAPGDQSAPEAVITLTRAMATVTGQLVDDQSAPAPDYTVVLFSADARFWLPQARRVQAARPGTDGRFTIGGLPAGEYRLAAVTDVEQDQWYAPEFLRALVPASIEIRLGEGERREQVLRVR